MNTVKLSDNTALSVVDILMDGGNTVDSMSFEPIPLFQNNDQEGGRGECSCVQCQLFSFVGSIYASCLESCTGRSAAEIGMANKLK